MDLGMVDRTVVRSEQRRFALMAGAFAVVAAIAIFDLAVDLRQGATPEHVILEGATAALGVLGLCFGASRVLALEKRTRELEREAGALSERLQNSFAEAQRWREEAKELLQGLGALIDRQFERWGLTQAEREVSRLILKGFSHKEIALLRSVVEATVRQQAAAIYKKAGVSGRHELSAFFLEDLLPPGDDSRNSTRRTP
ncbi:helix-turn-helix transcriptional regulator [Engelhardtia mirabilis]|uniref:Bacterial regulatory protein, luxR family n=1 Tax=Engelhardtia mirabilis TaxID=2528011 RepID=A0A518BH12_9BACT|nr:Bacterial regulatory protein, luxR family [Planctomycetes bacterium Pla133]QDV00605.1 Bacterial regulatory protein, luxR family [Planctomycetes bacterium Pla86]